jgi:hypothetical protein
MTDTVDTPAPDADSKGLLDDAKSTPDTPTNPDPNATTIPHLVDDKPDPVKVIEKRLRPDYVPEKFWDADKGELKTDVAMKSYAELEKNFKLGKHKPPEGGKYDLTPLGAKASTDDPVISTYTEWATKHGLSQAAFEELAGKVLEVGRGLQTESQVSFKAEREALGEHADAIVSSMVDWARGFVAKGVWTGEDFDEFKIMGGTAKGMRALMRMREAYEGRVPLKETIPNDVGMSDEELAAMVGDPKYKTNEGGFRDKVEKLYEKRYGGRAA